MEEEAPSRRSVAELAGRFKGSAPPQPAAETQEKPVRRRPPRTLQLPKTQGDEQEPPGVTSPLPAKAKRNSALIEKLQANLVLSPVALLPSPKSPGFRLLPPAFPLPSPGSGPVTTVTTSSTATPSAVAASPLTEEEGPTSFEAPPTVGEGSILSNDNIKSRARHSIRRRPPSRRHRKSSSGDEVGVASEGGDLSLSSPSEPEDKTAGGGETEGGQEGPTDEDKTAGGGETEGGQEGPTDEDKTAGGGETEGGQEGPTDGDKTAGGGETEGGQEGPTDGDKTAGGGETEGGQEGPTDEVGEDKTDVSTCPQKNESHEEDHSSQDVKKTEGDKESGGTEEEEEKKSGEKQKEDLTEGATNTDTKEEDEIKNTTGSRSVR